MLPINSQPFKYPPDIGIFERRPKSHRSTSHEYVFVFDGFILSYLCLFLNNYFYVCFIKKQKQFSVPAVYRRKEMIRMIFFSILFVAIAILNIFYPRFGWYMRYGWMVKGDSEPSDAYLLMSRISSVIVLIVFLFVFLPLLF
ncbi:DUF6199 family natural product biosynthesis protein [Paenibacillus pectinilyticus]